MCNSAEQTGVDCASDLKSNNVVSETNNLVICPDTSTAEGTRKAVDSHSNGSLVEINEAAVCLSSNSLIAANGVDVDHSYDTSGHFANDVLISGKEIVKRVDQRREPSKTCIKMTTSFSEGNEIVKDGTHIPSVHFKGFLKTSEYVCNSNLVKLEDDVHPLSAEYRRVETEPMETTTLTSKTKSSQIEEEASQGTSKELVGELVTPAGCSDGANGQASFKAVETLNFPLVSGGSESAAKSAKELSLDCCRGAEKPEIRTDLVHAGDTVEADDHLLLEGLPVGFQGHSTGPCTETDSVMVVNNSDLSLDAKENVSIDSDVSLAWIEMRPAVAEQIAASSEESSSGAIQITMNREETENETAVGSLETQNTTQQFEHMRQDIVVIGEHAETLIPTTAMSSKEDAAEHVPRSFKEANRETPNEIEQGTIGSSTQVRVTDTVVLKQSSQPELAEFFGNATGSKHEKEIEEQECAPVMAKVPLQKKLFMESPRSLRMLLFSEETALPTKKDEKHKKDGKSMEFSSKVVPAAESHGNENHTEHQYPARWYENPDNGETSSTFSGPIAFSGVISYSGQFLYSGSTSHRSDSSTSTRSFAFPILASDWNSSPVKMGAPDPRYYRARRKWRCCFCCRRPSTLFD